MNTSGSYFLAQAGPRETLRPLTKNSGQFQHQRGACGDTPLAGFSVNAAVPAGRLHTWGSPLHSQNRFLLLSVWPGEDTGPRCWENCVSPRGSFSHADVQFGQEPLLRRNQGGKLHTSGQLFILWIQPAMMWLFERSFP